MEDICSICGLPKEICTCNERAQENQDITVSSRKRTFGKIVTVVEGLGGEKAYIKDLASVLKKKLACGGTVKNGRIELQGEHKKRVKNILVNEEGFPSQSIEID